MIKYNNINNYPEYAKTAKYIVARWCDGEWWFWGAYNDLMQANRIAGEIGGIVNKNI